MEIKNQNGNIYEIDFREAAKKIVKEDDVDSLMEELRMATVSYLERKLKTEELTEKDKKLYQAKLEFLEVMGKKDEDNVDAGDGLLGL